MSVFSRSAGLGLAASVAFAAGAQADDLLIVDLTVPNQVTISATSGLSAVSASGGDTTGVYLDNFYGVAGGSLSTSSTGAGDLTNFENPSDGSPALFRAGGGSDTGLNVWSWSSDITVTFTAGGQAFQGSGTWALDAPEYADMVNGNSSGALYFPADSFDDVPNAVQLGTYRVIVPAPTAASLLGVTLGIGAMRRRR